MAHREASATLRVGPTDTLTVAELDDFCRAASELAAKLDPAPPLDQVRVHIEHTDYTGELNGGIEYRMRVSP